MTETPENQATEAAAGTSAGAATELTDEQKLAMLKAKATKLGITYSGNIGLETLRNKINDHMAAAEEGKTADKEAAGVDVPDDVKLRVQLKKEKTKLVRCKIYNLNPGKRDLRGELITVGNRYIGTHTKMIPFGEATENGYHIPQVIYDHLKSRKFQSIKTKTVNGKIKVETQVVPEYQLEVLPQLTKEELAELAKNQEAAKRVGLV